MKIKPILLYGGLTVCTTLGLRSGCGQLNEEKRCMKLSEPIDMYVGATNNPSLAGLKQVSINPAAFNFTESLTQNETLLKNTLNISEERFDLYRDLAIGIAKEETDLGLEKWYLRKKNYPRISAVLKWCSGITGTETDRTLSKGFTNFKIDAVGPKEAGILKKLGVKDIYDSSQSALATIAHICTINEDYNNKYMKRLAPYHEVQFGTVINPVEYILARWKNLRLDTGNTSTVKDTAMENMKMIIADRTSDAPTTYVWRILKSLGYVWDANSGKVIKRVLHR